MSKLTEELNNPSREYRPLPFWSWNDRLEPELLAWQIREMDRAGLGGYFMHARGGLETEYLGEEWMACVKACLDEGKKTGMGSWIYDEDGWPSGFAGGLVTALGDRYHGRWLQYAEYTGDPVDDSAQNVLGVYYYDQDKDQYYRVPIFDAHRLFEKSMKVLVVRHASNPYYIDVMSREAVRAFLDCTHERYYKHFGDEFGTGIKGFFTDEPRLTGSIEGDVPWSYDLPEAFRAKYGYELLDVLPALAYPCTGFEKIRYDFWELVSELFVASFMKQINDWCEAHHCQLTGHLMMEESIFTQMTGTAGVMPFYEHMGVPGIDWLRRMIGSPVVPRQVGSVASQLGKKFVLSESFALCGWNVSFEELKWIAEWQFVNGVNLLCQHLEGYTLRGLRKRDYPPSLFTQQPWWEEYEVFNTYMARLGKLLSSGTPQADVLMLHPMRSGWITYNGSQNEEIRQLDEEFTRATETLSGLHVEYHYGDETILAGHGRVEQDRLVVGNCTYKAVVMPSMQVISGKTLELLQAFAENGGRIVSMGGFPAFCNGIPDDRLLALNQSAVHTGPDEERLRKALEEKGVTCVRIMERDRETEIWEIHAALREVQGDRIVFMVNHDTRKSFLTNIFIPGVDKAILYNAKTGKEEYLVYSCVNGGVMASLEFLPMQSHIVIAAVRNGMATAENSGITAIGDTTEQTVQADSGEKVFYPGVEWTVKEMSLNSLTLDTCRYNIDHTGWKGPKPVIHLMKELLELKRSCDIDLAFEFTIDMDLDKNKVFFLAIEKAGEFSLSVNEQNLEYRDQGWWKDSSFKKVDIRPFLRQGRNEVILSRKFYESPKVYEVLFGNNVYETEKNKLTYDVELESIYAVGDFGVTSRSEFLEGDRKSLMTNGPFTIVDRPEAVVSGDLTRQGFCFFAGSVVLSQTIRVDAAEASRVRIDFGKPDAVLMKVMLNGNEVSHLCWAPFIADVTDWIRDGENTLDIVLFPGNRNLLGPHHHISGEPYNVGPSSFSGEWSWVEKSTEAIPATAEDRRKNYWMDAYGFVRFGLNPEPYQGR